MASFTIPKGGFQKRQTLAERLNHLEMLEGDEGDEMRFGLLGDLQRVVDAAKSFRWHAPSTQNRQDIHLRKYRQFVYTILLTPSKDQAVAAEPGAWEEVPEDEWSKELFPSDYKKMANTMKLFMIFAFQSAAPRAKAANTIEMRSFCAYRDSLLFWADHYYFLREETFDRRKLFNDLVQSMRYAQTKFGDVFKKKSKTWSGLAELRQLFDWEMATNRNIELSEEHQVLWCIGRVTALRPGSLCPPTRNARTDPLKWKDFRIFRGDEKGQFTVTMTVDHITIKRENDPMKIGEADVTSMPLTMTFASPETRNIVFSPAHRLLVIALRRGILEHISSLDELLEHPNHEIFVKKRHENDMVFLRGKSKGVGMDQDSPLTSNALTEYLNLRGKLIGYDQPITWYSIRRRAATDMVRRVGTNTTRFLLGHAPDSHTLERYYLDMTSTFDNMGVLLEQGISSGGVSDTAAKNWHPLALNKLENAAFQHSRGRALSQLIRRIILADEDGPDVTATSAEMKNYRRRVKRYAQKLLVDKESEWQRRKMSKTDMDERKGLLSASEFTKEVLSRALDSLTDVENGLQAGADPEEGADDEGLDELFDDADEYQAADADLESTVTEELLDKDGTLKVTFEAETETEIVALNDVSYEAVAKEAMRLWLENPLTTHKTWKFLDDEEKKCPTCQDDATADEKTRNKVYFTRLDLQRHLDGIFHHPGTTWIRKSKAPGGKNSGYTCTYCENDAHFDGLDALVEHVQQSNVRDNGAQHDRLKETDGWYDDDWEDPRYIAISAGDQADYQVKGIRKMKAVGIDTKPMDRLVHPVPHAAGGTLLRGTYPPERLHPRYTGQITSSPNPTIPDTPIPAHLQSTIQTSINMDLINNPIPDYMRGTLRLSSKPRSGETMGANAAEEE